RARVARHHEPTAAATAVKPELLMQARWVLAQIDVVMERLHRVWRCRSRTPHGRIAEIGELVVAARTAKGTGDAQRDLNANSAGRPRPFRLSARRSPCDRAASRRQPKRARRARSGARSTNRRRASP